MSVIERLAAERKARLLRFEAAAYGREPRIAKPVVVQPAPIPEPEPAAHTPWVDWMNTTTRIKTEVLKDYPAVTMRALDAHGRRTVTVRARHIAMYLVRVIAKMSLPDIGRRFGGRDHSSVLHGIRKIGWLIEKDEAFAAHVAAIRRRIEEHEHRMSL